MLAGKNTITLYKELFIQLEFLSILFKIHFKGNCIHKIVEKKT